MNASALVAGVAGCAGSGDRTTTEQTEKATTTEETPPTTDESERRQTKTNGPIHGAPAIAGRRTSGAVTVVSTPSRRETGP
ncbi:hypothetical protein [Halorussus salinisoli]|uniref:hypothetical protein n=1 Tax=Halorussus salinisoli TaxID=2558242 RepID=UPI0010C15F5D|nr:hypothetical protein [Halorussus salinisoli]